MPHDIATKHVCFSGRLLILGFGSIGQGVLPLLLRHIDMPKENISILTADARGNKVAAELDVPEEILPLTTENYREVLSARLGAG
ncbi:MAG: saccharopine dehydrogenase NADP-binding domain-containing protein, partial [Acidocella sp.]|uniref:saccharopine dehydrogenase NADP-binding domain-containing protein n=1 Tax=Acidocella sp. TaxID=50710 RepID=UPI003FD88ED4